MKKTIFRWIVGTMLMTISLAAFATTATFHGKYGSYPTGSNHFDVRAGETIDMEGHCAADGSFAWSYDSLWYTEWTIDGHSTDDKGTATGKYAGEKRHPFVVSGRPGHSFGVKMQCFSDNSPNFTNDSASRQFTILKPSPPSVAWRNTNPKYANDKITINVDVASTGDGVKDVYILWPGAPRHDLRMTHIAGDQYQYEIDTSRLPQGMKEVNIWATSNSGDHNGWQTAGRFTVDHNAPAIYWEDKNPKYAQTSITIEAAVSDMGSGVSDVWIRWPGAASQSIKMNNVSGRRYRYTIDASQLPPGKTDVQIRAGDRVGNDTGWQVKGYFTVDRLAPKIIWNDTNVQFSKTATLIKVNVSDAVSGVANVWLQWTGGSSSYPKMKKDGNDQYSYLIPSLPDGIKDVQIGAMDDAGNTTGWVSKGSFIVDTTAPVVNWLEPSDQAVLPDGKIHIAGNIVDDYPDYVVIEWRQKDDPVWQSHTVTIERAAHNGHADFQYDLPAPEQGVDYVLRLHAADKAGNVSADTPPRTVTTREPALPDEEQQLRLKKTVDKKTALPGEILHYTITFTNVSTEDLSEIVIKDTIQNTYLTLRSAQCGPSMPDGLQCCVPSEQGKQCGNAVAPKPRALEWHFNGVLEAGESGSVSYDVQVDTQ